VLIFNSENIHIYRNEKPADPPAYSEIKTPKAEIQSENIHQHQQKLEPMEPVMKVEKKVESEKVNQISNNEAEEIRRLKAELQEALKKIEMLSR
jgi:hypothetical protein